MTSKIRAALGNLKNKLSEDARMPENDNKDTIAQENVKVNHI